MSEIQNAIEVKNLKKGFGGRVLFENFSLNVKANTIHAIIGPNGSGKTTLLRLITGVYQPNAGTINIAGKYAMQLENDYLYEEQTGLENLKIFGKYFGFEINDRSDGYCCLLYTSQRLHNVNLLRQKVQTQRPTKQRVTLEHRQAVSDAVLHAAFLRPL